RHGGFTGRPANANLGEEMGTVSFGPGLDPREPSRRPPRYVAGFEVLDKQGLTASTCTYRVRRDSTAYVMEVVDPRERGEAAKARFLRLAALLATIDHPGLAQVHEAGSVDGVTYMVMDLIEGRPLTRVLDGGRHSLEKTIRLGIDLAGALGAAH